MTLDHRRRGSSQPFLLTALEALDRRLWLPAIECVLVAAFVLVIALDGHRAKTSRLTTETAPPTMVAGKAAATAGAEAPVPTPSDNPIATEMQPRPRDMGSAAASGSFPSIIPPSLQQEYPRETTATGPAVPPDTAGSALATNRPPPAQARAESSATIESPSRAREVAVAAPPSIIPPALQYQYPRETTATGPATPPEAASASGATPNDTNPPAPPASNSTPAPTASNSPMPSGQAAFEAALMGRPRAKAPNAPSPAPPGDAAPQADVTASATSKAPVPTAAAPSGQAAFEAALMGRPRRKAPAAPPETPPSDAGPRAEMTTSATSKAPPPRTPASSGQAALEAVLLGRPGPKEVSAIDALSKAPTNSPEDGVTIDPTPDTAPAAKPADADRSASVSSPATPGATAPSGQAAFEAALTGRPRPKAAPMMSASPETTPGDASPRTDAKASVTSHAQPPNAAASPSGQAALEAALTGRSKPKTFGIDAPPPSLSSDGVTIDPAPVDAAQEKPVDASATLAPIASRPSGPSGQSAFEAALAGRTRPQALPAERSPATPLNPPTKVAALDPAPPAIPQASLAGHSPPAAAPLKDGAVSEVSPPDPGGSWDQARAQAGLLGQPGSETPAAKPTSAAKPMPSVSTPSLRDIAVPPGTIPKPGEAAKAPAKATADLADAKTASKAETPSERPVVASQTKVARLEPQGADKGEMQRLREQQDFADAFQSASRMLERRLTPDERAASMAPDYVDAIQRMEGIYDPTKVGPFGSGLRMAIRPGTMSMTDVFGERWTRADPDPNVHYRVGFHAETWLRPRSRKCEEFWRFRTDDSPVALDKLAPADCARVRSKPESDTKLMADSTIVAAPISVPTFAAPYPGGRMSHDELMAALKARADAAREKLWYGRSHGLVEQKPRPAPALAPSN